MRIFNIKKETLDQSVRISADIHFDKNNKVENVFYEFERKYEKFLSVDATPFLAAFLLCSMKIGEEIILDGEVSPTLIKNIQLISDLVTSWKIGFKSAKINCQIKSKDDLKGNGTACFFSLGVDSFYTYLSHKHDRKPIKNLIFVHGFDIDLQNTELYKSALSKMKEIAKLERINVIPVKTNIKKITDRYIEWDWEHGGAMASVALMLPGKLGKVYFAGSDSWIQRKKVMPYGTHPDLDGLWSTGNLQIVHDGNESTRLQKIQKVVSKSPLALKYLRVCNQNLKGKYNCSNCEKCIRTMIDLKICDSLKYAKTFQKEIPLEKLSNIHNEDYDTKIYFEDSLKELKKINKHKDLQIAIQKSLFKSNHPSLLTRTVKSLSGIDRIYNKGRVFGYIFQTTKNGDRNVVFKTLVKMSIIR